jgi:hypothetical protein
LTKQLQVYDTQTQTWSLKSQAIAYTFDNAYRLTSEVRTENQTETYREEFTYDDAMRLKTVQKDSDTAATYNYDTGGRRTSLAKLGGPTFGRPLRGRRRQFEKGRKSLYFAALKGGD